MNISLLILEKIILQIFFDIGSLPNSKREASHVKSRL